MITRADIQRCIPLLHPKTRRAEICHFHENTGELDVKHRGTAYLIPLEYSQIWDLNQRTSAWLRANSKRRPSSTSA